MDFGDPPKTHIPVVTGVVHFGGHDVEVAAVRCRRYAYYDGFVTLKRNCFCVLFFLLRR